MDLLQGFSNKERERETFCKTLDFNLVTCGLKTSRLLRELYSKNTTKQRNVLKIVSFLFHFSSVVSSMVPTRMMASREFEAQRPVAFSFSGLSFGFGGKVSGQ